MLFSIAELTFSLEFMCFFSNLYYRLTLHFVFSICALGKGK